MLAAIAECELTDANLRDICVLANPCRHPEMAQAIADAVVAHWGLTALLGDAVIDHIAWITHKPTLFGLALQRAVTPGAMCEFMAHEMQANKKMPTIGVLVERWLDCHEGRVPFLSGTTLCMCIAKLKDKFDDRLESTDGWVVEQHKTVMAALETSADALEYVEAKRGNYRQFLIETYETPVDRLERFCTTNGLQLPTYLQGAASTSAVLSEPPPKPRAPTTVLVGPYQERSGDYGLDQRTEACEDAAQKMHDRLNKLKAAGELSWKPVMWNGQRPERTPLPGHAGAHLVMHGCTVDGDIVGISFA